MIPFLERRAEVSSAEAGQTVSLALRRVMRADVRKGMVIAHKSEAPPRGKTVLHFFVSPAGGGDPVSNTARRSLLIMEFYD